MDTTVNQLPNACTIAIFDSQSAAEAAVEVLAKAGLGKDHISVVKRHVNGASENAEKLSIGDDSLHDAAVGGALGGLAGVVGAGTLISVTGVGLILLAGPLVALTGVIVGAFLGAMRGWGLHEVQIRQYEKLVEEGRVLVAVCGAPEEVQRAEKLLRHTQAKEVKLHARAADESPEVDDRPGT